MRAGGGRECTGGVCNGAIGKRDGVEGGRDGDSAMEHSDGVMGSGGSSNGGDNV